MFDQYILEEYFPDYEEAKIFADKAHTYYLTRVAFKDFHRLPQVSHDYMKRLNKNSHLEVVQKIIVLYMRCAKNVHHPNIVEHSFVEFYNLFANEKRPCELCEACGKSSLKKYGRWDTI
eukprot:Pompholyxophrys_punicea_v1_NODE_337_length_2211_cov_21.567718.p2 type:complete len:119 gc:universal NODE_337_length_2211_cov_21.567718:954-1310(+)